MGYKFTSTDVITEKMVRKRFHILCTQHYMLRSKLLVDENGNFYYQEMIFPDGDDNWIPLKISTETNEFRIFAIIYAHDCSIMRHISI